MAERSNLWLHLARGLEELLRAGATAAEQLAERAERLEPPGGTEGVAETLARWIERADGPGLDALREGLRRERSRWNARALDDPAAARVRDFFAALLDVLEGEPAGDAGEARPAARHSAAERRDPVSARARPPRPRRGTPPRPV